MSDLASYLGNGLFLLAVIGVPAIGLYKRVPVYDAFVEGAKGSFDVAVKIIPFYVGMMVAIGMLRSSGALTLLSQLFSPVLQRIGFPSELLPLALIRPFSGAASNAMLIDNIHHYGPDSMIAKISATIMGSTETTFYVIAVYFGSVGIKHIRHAAITGLLADAAGVVAAIVICRQLF